MNRSTDQKLKEFMEVIAKMLDQKLGKIKDEIRNELKPQIINAPLQPVILPDNSLINAKLNIVASGGDPNSRASFIQQLGPLMVQYGINSVNANLRKEI